VNFLEFRTRMFTLACFNVNQVYAWQPDFSRNNLVRWTNQKQIVRLRQGYYTFPEYLTRADYLYLFANRMYRPSYISLHTALASYGIIPEAVTQVTCVTSLKTASFTNLAGTFIYKSVREDMMFGYISRPMADDHTVLFASPEKALADLLYLYPFYNSEREMEELRLDLYFMQEELNKNLLLEYSSRTRNKALEKRINLLLTSYGL
jgi:predicted transcriptional regulator of viral defense system